MAFAVLGDAPASPNPPGNNGTIKVDDLPFDDHPDNEPHVGCTFQADFYGFDEGDLFDNNAADDVNEHDNYEATELDINDEHVSAIERAVEGLARQETAPDLD